MLKYLNFDANSDLHLCLKNNYFSFVRIFFLFWFFRKPAVRLEIKSGYFPDIYHPMFRNTIQLHFSSTFVRQNSCTVLFTDC